MEIGLSRYLIMMRDHETHIITSEGDLYENIKKTHGK